MRKSVVRVEPQLNGSVRVRVSGAVTISAACKAAHDAMARHGASRATLHLGTVFKTDVTPTTTAKVVCERYNTVRDQRRYPADVWTPIQTKLR